MLINTLTSLFAKPVQLETIYGKVVVDHPLIAELIESSAFQRLKHINQYGVVNYITPTERYTRYDHSIGVYLLLKEYGATLEEQVAGLLHDVSHTVFSHVGDYVFQENYPGNSYQDDIHIWYLKESGIDEILGKYRLNAELIDHKLPHFKMLEQNLPFLCADRIEYNLQGGLKRGLISQQDFAEIRSSLHYKNDVWFFDHFSPALNLGRCSLIMTETLWGAAWESLCYQWAADALRRAFELELVSFYEFHFSTDDLVWKTLSTSSDPVIIEIIKKMHQVHELFELTADGQEDFLIKQKFRGINPLIQTEQGLKPLTALDQTYKSEFDRVKRLMGKGWSVRLKNNFSKPETI